MIKIATVAQYRGCAFPVEQAPVFPTKESAVEDHIKKCISECEYQGAALVFIMRFLASKGLLAYEPEEVTRYKGGRGQLFDDERDALHSLICEEVFVSYTEGASEEAVVRRLIDNGHINYEVVSDDS